MLWFFSESILNSRSTNNFELTLQCWRIGCIECRLKHHLICYIMECWVIHNVENNQNKRGKYVLFLQLLCCPRGALLRLPIIQFQRRMFETKDSAQCAYTSHIVSLFFAFLLYLKDFVSSASIFARILFFECEINNKTEHNVAKGMSQRWAEREVFGNGLTQLGAHWTNQTDWHTYFDDSDQFRVIIVIGFVWRIFQVFRFSACTIILLIIVCNEPYIRVFVCVCHNFFEYVGIKKGVSKNLAFSFHFNPFYS